MKNLKKLPAILAVSTLLSSSALADNAFVAVGLNLLRTTQKIKTVYNG